MAEALEGGSQDEMTELEHLWEKRGQPSIFGKCRNCDVRSIYCFCRDLDDHWNTYTTLMVIGP